MVLTGRSSFRLHVSGRLPAGDLVFPLKNCRNDESPEMVLQKQGCQDK